MALTIRGRLHSWLGLGRNPAAGLTPVPVLALSLVLVAVTSSSCSAPREIRAPDPAVVVAHSEGLVSRHADLSVVLSTGRDVSALADANPFSFTPSIKGTVHWSEDGTRADFRPEVALKAGTVYRGVFDFSAIGEPANGWFSFTVRSAEPGLAVAPGVLYAAKDGYLAVDGSVRTEDIPSVAEVQSLVSASISGTKMDLSWSHEGTGLHRFTVTGIPQGSADSELVLAWDGRSAGSKVRGSHKYRIPAQGSFEVLSIQGPESADSSAISISFSAPVDPGQDFRGLIRASVADESLRFEAEGGMVRIHSSLRWPETVDVSVERGLRSTSLGNIAVPVNATVNFDWQVPQVRFPAGGVIVPTSQGTRIVLETCNLATVLVEAVRVYGDNLLQFMQVNELDGSRELRRVGDVVWRAELDLGWNDGQKNQWISHALDLSPLLKDHPDGLFQIRVTFGRQHIRYVSPNNHASFGKWTFPELEITDPDDESSYWDYSEEWFDWNEYYRYREDPTHPAFYVTRYGKDRTARRNVLVSDVGLMARCDADGAWHVAVTDLRSAQPVPGAALTIYSYAMRQLAVATAGPDGTAIMRPQARIDEAAPAFLVAEAPGITSMATGGTSSRAAASATASNSGSSAKGYLKLAPASALSVSHFDIGGQEADSGIKGFIYGERGVWRPGDDMHLGFILFDPRGSLPPEHPVAFELENPLGQVTSQATYTSSVNGFYYMKASTEASAPTGSWTARVRVGGRTFTKALKVEMVMPNRLKMALAYGDKPYIGAEQERLGLSAAWLHGAPAPGLKADVSMMLSASAKAPGDYPGYAFLDPLRSAPSGRELLFEGYLDETGTVDFPVDLSYGEDSPGPLRASFLSRVFERSGLFSSEQFSVDFHPYKQYVGVKVPAGDAARNMLLTDTDHSVELLLVDRDGKPVRSGRLEVAVYKLQWRWWWEKGQESLAEQASDIYEKLIKKETVNLRGGRASWKLRINYPDWGRYLIRVTDLDGGHASGTIFYIDWPGWAGRSMGEGGGSASMLSLSTDRERYEPGQKVKVSFPSNREGKAYVAVERAGRIIGSDWVDGKDGSTVYEFTATDEMAPNVYVHVSFLQPHLQTANDLPIRLYGVVPVMVEDPATRLVPVIDAPQTLMPSSTTRFSVYEKDGKAMTYTVAVVDEGLLGITRFATADPWNEFYKKEASLLTSYDLYKDVAGAYSGRLQTLLSIGGSEFGDEGGERKSSRFPPVVRHLGPFNLAKGQRASHELELGPYIGAVRFMVVAGTPEGAYGKAELERPVKAELMAFITAPRVLGPNENLSLPVTVFGFMGRGAQVRLNLSVEGQASVVGSSVQTLRFVQEGEQVAVFELKTGTATGSARVHITAVGPGNRTSSQTVDLPVRSSSVPVTALAAELLPTDAKHSIRLDLPGLPGSNEAWLELSLLPPVDLSGRLGYLLGYPHGCGEQITSQVFPQLFLEDAMALTPEQAAGARANVAAGIAKLAEFQSTRGGFVFWPGAYDESPWLSAYVSHFLVMARKQGYTVPDALLDSA
ncbi:MAG: alpha-2-macroglobulin, partial [Clostridia bacterium]